MKKTNENNETNKCVIDNSDAISEFSVLKMSDKTDASTIPHTHPSVLPGQY